MFSAFSGAEFRALCRTSGRAAAARVAAVTLAGVLVAGASGGVAAADGPLLPSPQSQPGTRQSGAAAVLGELRTYGTAVVRDRGTELRVPAGLFEMAVEGGGTLRTYGVDLRTPVQAEARYRETPWSGTLLHDNADAGRIRWILEHSYPQVNDLAALAERAGSGTLTEEDAASGTQVAVWRYAGTEPGVEVVALDPQAERLADFLVGKARKLPEPPASLSLESPAVSGTATRPEERVEDGAAAQHFGPVTVRTSAGTVNVAPSVESGADGVRIVDGKGQEVETARDGSRLYFQVPRRAAEEEDTEGAGGTDEAGAAGGSDPETPGAVRSTADAGTAELTVQASTTVPVGRAFTSESGSQTQVLAGSSGSTVTATATARWAPGGAIPAFSAEENCATGGVDLAVANGGDEPFAFTLAGTGHTVPPGRRTTVALPVPEDGAYDFTVTDPHGEEHRFQGLLDCEAAAGTTVVAAAGEGPGGLEAAGGVDEEAVVAERYPQDLAATGASGMTGTVLVTALALLVGGGLLLLLVRKKH